MAANDYYNTSYHGRREDAPLPATPSSPFDDHTYPYQHPQSSYSSFAGASSRNDGRDPFTDQHAVPMHDYTPNKHTSQSSEVPIVPEPYDDPFVRDAKRSRWGRRRGGRNNTKKGWFSGRITWVCYILTLIQLVVFIVEIVKNGMLLSAICYVKAEDLTIFQPS